MTAQFEAHPALQGYDGILHGGVIGALLDAVMTHLLLHRGIPAMTAEMRVRYTRQVPCDGTMFLSARMKQERPPLYRLCAELLAGGVRCASAEASFIYRGPIGRGGRASASGDRVVHPPQADEQSGRAESVQPG
jgi:acyl-coenzyme A thioesterase PaaI-like protein